MPLLIPPIGLIKIMLKHSLFFTHFTATFLKYTKKNRIIKIFLY